MEKKQTAVDWLIDQMFKQGYFDGNKPLSITNLDHLQHHAKEMEKQQIMDAWDDGNDNEIRGGKYRRIIREKYYNEEYGGNNEQQ